ncbi:hypothetical protein C8C77_106118 [Halanaerobium saccharolyticum]|uniref:Uncharacterized protein n=1 Tax=Halanaerobium saccharolyticum TaxID=43595 RepID=A0A4V6Q874_9FIRM|nr:hypothetical protein [Halanaerobium saccharolyticum]RAK09413.1 hypothetical protein C7958_107118 [Halanaerobium saccharolyticum]TDW06270.1 hypothetical protein C8C77_106118 [Halanaerobium saccharolyticum]TDX61064.1 hypothetical protein C7956_107118 [Halanaerobium saccharolyticum]
MEDIYQYNKYKFLEKLYTPIGIFLAGILLQFFYPGIGIYQKLLIYLVYLSGVLLFTFDTLPILISTYKVWNKEIILTNRTIVLKGDDHLKTRVVNRKDIERVIFRSLRGEDVEIPHYRKLEDIDEDLYELAGRKFIIEYDTDAAEDELTIYLELLPEEFIEEFIKWYQADIALK